MFEVQSDNEDAVNLALRRGQQVLFVSLYLVLLAFFIILGRIAYQDEDKTRQALLSVRKSFADEEGKGVLPELKLIRPISFEVFLTNYYSKIGKLAQNRFQFENVKVLRSGNSLNVIIPKDMFFKFNSKEFKRESSKFVDDVVSSLTVDTKGVRIEAQFLMSSEDYLSDELDADVKLDIKRMGELARKFAKKGVDEKNIAIGLMPGEENKITISFLARDVESSKFNFQAGDRK